MKKVFIIVLNFNGWQDTVECVRSIHKLEKPDGIRLETVVIDNGSSNDSVKKIEENTSGITLIKNKENLGFSGGSNTGIKYALENSADYVILLNNDTIVHKDLMRELLKASVGESVGGVVPKIYFAKGHEYHKDKYKKEDLGKVIWYAGGEMDWKNLIGKNIGVDEVDRGQYDIKQETQLATGCCVLIKAEVLKKVGMFDERYFLYYEDADLTERIKRAGYKIIFAPDALLWHVNAGSGGGSGSFLQDYYISRNRLLLGMSYAPARTKAALVRESFRILVGGRLWQKKGVADFYLRRFGKGSFHS